MELLYILGWGFAIIAPIVLFFMNNRQAERLDRLENENRVQFSNLGRLEQLYTALLAARHQAPPSAPFASPPTPPVSPAPAAAPTPPAAVVASPFPAAVRNPGRAGTTTAIPTTDSAGRSACARTGAHDRAATRAGPIAARRATTTTSRAFDGRGHCTRRGGGRSCGCQTPLQLGTLPRRPTADLARRDRALARGLLLRPLHHRCGTVHAALPHHRRGASSRRISRRRGIHAPHADHQRPADRRGTRRGVDRDALCLQLLRVRRL